MLEAVLVNSTPQLGKLGINAPPHHPHANILITTTTTTIQKDVPGTDKKMCRTEPSVTRRLSSRNSLAQINRLWLIDKIQGIFGWGGGDLDDIYSNSLIHCLGRDSSSLGGPNSTLRMLSAMGDYSIGWP